MLRFSEKSKGIGSASSIEQNELVYAHRRAGRDPIVMSYGEAPFTIEPFFADSSDFDRGAHYSDSRGTPEFVAEICAYVKRTFDADLGAENVMVSAGSKIISYLIARTFLNDGDAIGLHEPSWVSYQEHAKLSGASTRFHSYRAPIRSIVEELNGDGQLRLIYLNNPNNPRGLVYSERELLELAEITESRGIVLAIDESYSDFTEGEFYSGAKMLGQFDNVIVFHSLSKNFGLSGWRLGYALASEQICTELNKLNMHLITCAPTLLQLALVNRLELLQEQIRPQIEGLKRKRKEVVRLLTDKGFEVLDGSSTFYVFINVSRYLSSTREFVKKLLIEHGVSVISGDSYGASTGGFIRISISIEPIHRIAEGLDIMKNALESI